MDFLKFEVGSKRKNRRMRCICLNQKQFVTDCDKLTDCIYDGFSINPKERFNDKITSILNEIESGKRALPSRFSMRLENRHSICNCRIDYVFEVVTKDFLKEANHRYEFDKDTLNLCLKSDVDCIMLYVGMNR